MPHLLDDDFELPQKKTPKPPLPEQQRTFQQWLSTAIVLSCILGGMLFHYLFDDFDQTRSTLRNSLLIFSPLLRIIFVGILALSSFSCALERRQKRAIFQRVSLPSFKQQSISEALAEFFVWLALFALVVVVVGWIVVLVMSPLGLGQVFSLQKTTILISIGITVACYGYRAHQLGSDYLRKDNRT